MHVNHQYTRESIQVKYERLTKTKSEKETLYFYVVKPQRGNIHWLIPQPPVKQIHYTKMTYTLKAINTMISTSSYHLLLNPRARDSLSLLSIQAVSYTSRKKLPIQGSQASRKIFLLSNLDQVILVKLS